MLYVVMAALALAAITVAVPLLRRSTELSDVEAFHHARTLTTTWAAQPVEPLRLPGPDEDPAA